MLRYEHSMSNIFLSSLVGLSFLKRANVNILKLSEHSNTVPKKKNKIKKNPGVCVIKLTKGSENASLK